MYDPVRYDPGKPGALMRQMNALTQSVNERALTGGSRDTGTPRGVRQNAGTTLRTVRSAAGNWRRDREHRRNRATGTANHVSRLVTAPQYERRCVAGSTQLDPRPPNSVHAVMTCMCSSTL
jgi:hypothetical protein